METVRNLDMTPPAPSGRTDAFLKAVRHTLWDFLTGKNSLRSFQDRYRFNIIGGAHPISAHLHLWSVPSCF